MEQCWSKLEVSPGIVVGCLLPAGHENQGRKHYHAKLDDPTAYWTWWDYESESANHDLDKIRVYTFSQLMRITVEKELVIDAEEACRRWLHARDNDKKLYYIPSWKSVQIFEEE